MQRDSQCDVIISSLGSWFSSGTDVFRGRIADVCQHDMWVNRMCRINIGMGGLYESTLVMDWGNREGLSILSWSKIAMGWVKVFV